MDFFVLFCFNIVVILVVFPCDFKKFIYFKKTRKNFSLLHASLRPKSFKSLTMKKDPNLPQTWQLAILFITGVSPWRLYLQEVATLQLNNIHLSPCS